MKQKKQKKQSRGQANQRNGKRICKKFQSVITIDVENYKLFLGAGRTLPVMNRDGFNFNSATLAKNGSYNPQDSFNTFNSICR